jgi:hypothetical protein
MQTNGRSTCGVLMNQKVELLWADMWQKSTTTSVAYVKC